MNVLYILLALFIFGVLIFIHELGHFIVARLCGVKILEFALGMGPRILSHKSKKSGTVYSIRIFPIGGFVSMYGETGMEAAQGNGMESETDASDSEDGKRFFVSEIQEDTSKDVSNETEETVIPELAKQSYANQPAWKRILISIAGPLMNILLGFVLVVIMVASMGIEYLGTTVVARIPEGNTSSQAGLAEGDEIVQIGKANVHTFYQLNYEILNQGYRPVEVTVKRNGEKVVLENVTFQTITESGVSFGTMDFMIYREAKLNFPTLVKHSFWQAITDVKMVYDSLGGLIFGRFGVEAVSGPVGITQTITEAAKTSGFDVLHLVIIITINLGIMNLLPLPALDGGHLLLYIIEIIRRKPVPQKVEGLINSVGLILLLALAALIAIKDIIAL